MLFVLPIGGADMPVVISLLNAFTGLATSATGFEVHSNVLIVSGMLVGASGTLLTIMMGRAMNRSIGNVLFGAFGAVQTGAGTTASYEGTVRSVSAEDVAIMAALTYGVYRRSRASAVLIRWTVSGVAVWRSTSKRSASSATKK